MLAGEGGGFAFRNIGFAPGFAPLQIDGGKNLREELANRKVAGVLPYVPQKGVLEQLRTWDATALPSSGSAFIFSRRKLFPSANV